MLTSSRARIAHSAGAGDPRRARWVDARLTPARGMWLCSQERARHDTGPEDRGLVLDQGGDRLMMDRRHRVRVSSPNVHSKVFDDEVLVLDMASGMYFSLRGAAIDIWALVQAQA